MALEQYGRDWKSIAAQVQSRDARQCSSHAQKHFIKLCLAGKVSMADACIYLSSESFIHDLSLALSGTCLNTPKYGLFGSEV